MTPDLFFYETLPSLLFLLLFFFFNEPATTEIYTLSLHDALPICSFSCGQCVGIEPHRHAVSSRLDRKSTRLNSSHRTISYAVFCLKKKKTTNHTYTKHSTSTRKSSGRALSAARSHLASAMHLSTS